LLVDNSVSIRIIAVINTSNMGDISRKIDMYSIVFLSERRSKRKLKEDTIVVYFLVINELF
jgi:hypothetical protein